MPGTLIFVDLLVVATVALVAGTSFVGSMRRTQGRRLEGQVKGFRHL